MKVNPYLLFCLAAALMVPACSAQKKDAEGCKDSPLVGRFPGSVISGCDQKADNKFNFALDNGKSNTVEGSYLVVNYDYPKTASKAEVVRNMNTAIKKAGYIFDRDTGEYGDFTVHQGKTWIQIEIGGDGEYRETIVQQMEFAQLVVAHAPVASAASASAAAVKPEKPDAQGCKDSPLIGRFPGSYIDSCTQKADNSFTFDLGDGKNKKIEGRYLQIAYSCPRSASKAQVVRNMNTAFHVAGYTFDRDTGDYGDFTVHMGKTWLQIEIGGDSRYRETIVEETALTQDVVANAAQLQTGINTTGHIVVNGILFDTAKSDVKAESGPAIEQIAKLMQQDPKLKIYVVGHTDNVGQLAGNLDLSRRRAASVVQMLETQYHIAPDRLAPFGCGSYSPRMSNDTEDGRALNRRVELVKQ